MKLLITCVSISFLFLACAKDYVINKEDGDITQNGDTIIIDNEPFLYRITGAKVYAIEKEATENGTNHYRTDTCRNKVHFDIWTEWEMVEERKSSNASESPEFLTEGPGGIPIVDTDVSKTEVYFNKPIIYRNQTIPAFTNALTYNTQLAYQTGKKLNGLGVTYFHFHNDPYYVYGFDFPVDDYTVYFKWVLMDSTEITDQINLYIDPQW